MTRMHRRILVSLAATTTALIALTSCGTAGGADTMELSEEPVTISFSWWGATAREDLTNQAIDLFEKEHPNITVDAQPLEWGGYWDRLATATAGNDMPDVMQMDQIYLASYAARGTLLDLDTASDVLSLDAIPDTALTTGLVNDTQYAVPISVAPNAVAINTSVFEEYGVPLPDVDTWTWDEFEETAVALTEASGGEVHGLSAWGADSFTLTVWARQHGDELYDDKGNVAIDPEIAASYFQTVADQVESGATLSADRLIERFGLPLDQQALVTGTTGMAFIAMSQFTAIQSANPDVEYIPAPWPTDEDTEPGFQYLKPGMYWSAAARSEHPAEAALLIDFLINNEDVAKILGTDRGIPANPAFQDAIEPELDAGGQLALEFTASQAETAGEAPPITPNGASTIDAIMGRYTQAVLFGQSTADEAAKDFIAELQDSITTAG